MYKIIIFVRFIVFGAISHTSAYLILLISLSDNYFLKEVDEREVVTPTHTTCTHASRAHTTRTTHMTHHISHTCAHTTHTTCTHNHMHTHHTPRAHMHTYNTCTHTHITGHLCAHIQHTTWTYCNMHTSHMHTHHMHTCRHNTRTYNTHHTAHVHTHITCTHVWFLVLPSHSRAASIHFSSLLVNRLMVIWDCSRQMLVRFTTGESKYSVFSKDVSLF